MARLPQPPDADVLASVLRPDEDIVSVHPATRLVRVFTVSGRHPQQWNGFRRTGPLPHARFDTHPPGPRGRPTDAPGHGVLYFGLSVRTSIAEVFQDTSIVDRVTRRPFLVVVRPTRTLRLLDLSGLWPTQGRRVAGDQQRTAGTHAGMGAGDPAGASGPGRPVVPVVDGLRESGGVPVGPAGRRRAARIRRTRWCSWTIPGMDVPLARICEELNYTLLG